MMTLIMKFLARKSQCPAQINFLVIHQQNGQYPGVNSHLIVLTKLKLFFTS